MLGREAFQEIDYRQMFGPMAKWVAQIDEAERIPELRRARVPRRDLGPAGAGRARAARGHARRGGRRRRRRAATGRPGPHPAPPTSRGCGELLAGRERPLVDRRRTAAGRADGARRARRLVAEAGELPVAASFRCQDYVDNASPVYAGHLALGAGPGARRARPRRRRAARRRRPARRDHDRAATRSSRCRARRQALVHVHPGSRRARPRLPARAARSPPAPRSSRRPLRDARAARRRRVARVDGAGARASTSRTSAHAPAARRRSTSAR